MSEVLSNLRRMINSTLVTHADGKPLDFLAQHWGFPRPYWIGYPSWRGLLQAACYGKRGTGGCLFEAVESALGQYATVLDVQMNPFEPARLYSPINGFLQAHVGRYIRVPGYGIFRAIGPVDVDSVAGAYVDLCPIATRNWQAADWSGLDSMTEVAGATILPFEIHEPTPCNTDAREISEETGIRPGDPAVVRIYVFAGPDTITPPTYIQSGEALEFTADGTTDTLTFAAVHGFAEDAPVEVAGGYGARTAIKSDWTATLPQATIHVTNTTAFDATGTLQIASSEGVQNVTYSGKTLTTFTGCSGGEGLVAAGDDVVGIGTLPTNLAIDTVYYVIVSSTTEMQLAATVGGAAIDFVGNGSGTLVLLQARPADEPLGGHIQSDVAEDGDQVAGPFPPYLIGSEIMSDLAIILNKLVPAGVRVKLMRAPVTT